jgi:Holliday junction resolvase RusA-like endonuclease
MLKVRGTPIPAPRVTRKGKWADPRWRAYMEWRDRVKRAYAKHGGKMHRAPVALTMVFRRCNARADLDNLVKGLLDALTHVAWPSDTTKWIPRLSARFKKVKTPRQEGVELVIRELKEEA